MSTQFNFGRLHAIYSAAWTKNEPTIAFEVIQGRGRFVFMIFFSPEDKSSSGEHLFIYLRHMNSLLALKFYGSRRSGNFTVYLNDKQKEMMINELQLQPGAGNFSFNNFLSDLNINIPQELPEQIRVETLRDVWPCVSKELSDVVDESHKTILIGVTRLPDNSSPREKTLRKLYTFTDGSAEDIRKFINALKKNNYTLRWTANPDKKSKAFSELIVDMKR